MGFPKFVSYDFKHSREFTLYKSVMGRKYGVETKFERLL